MKYDNKKMIITILVSIFLVISLIIANINVKDNKKNNNDALKFKSEYEKYNDKLAFKNYKYPLVNISSNNSFVYSNIDEVINLLNSKSGIIYLGYPTCPWCRNAVNVLQKVNTKKIYYLNMKDIRDEYKIIDGVLTQTKQGDKKYKQLLEKLSFILEDYTVKDVNNNDINVGEKRIYVPLVIGVLNGKIVGYHMDTVSLNENQTPYDLLTKNQMEELKFKYDEIINLVYNDSCSLDQKGGC